MTPSQNVLFVAESVGDDEHEPPGLSIAKVLESGLRERNFSPSPPDNWRDCGWSMDLSVGEATLQIAIAATTEPRLWMLQVASTATEPGIIGRLLGKRTVDRSADVYAVASAIHDVLQVSGYSNIRWCLDGYPDEGESTPEPPPPGSP
jgi:hypothetical protein